MTFSPLTDWMPVDAPERGDLALAVSSIDSITDQPVWPAGWTAVSVARGSDETEAMMRRVVDGTEAWPESLTWEPSGRTTRVVIRFARMIPGGEGDPAVNRPRP